MLVMTYGTRKGRSWKVVTQMTLNYLQSSESKDNSKCDAEMVGFVKSNSEVPFQKQLSKNVTVQ